MKLIMVEKKRGMFSGLLRKAREEQGFSQKALAQDVGINPSYINRIESRERSAPKREIVLELAESLGLNEMQTDQLLVSGGYSPEYAKIKGGKVVYRLRSGD